MNFHRAIELDDTLPSSAQVEIEFLKNTTSSTSAGTYLARFRIDPEPILQRLCRVSLIDYAMVWTPTLGRYRIHIYGPEHIGAAFRALAVPIFESDQFVDLLLIDCDTFDHYTVCGRAHWLGGEQLQNQNNIRLHAHPMDWLAAGCEGVCNVSKSTSVAFVDLNKVARVHCDDIRTFLTAWDYTSDNTGTAKQRWVLDDDPANVLAFFDELADLRVVSALQATDSWPRGS